MQKIKFVVGGLYWCPKLGDCVCLDTISIEHTSYFPIKLKKLGTSTENKAYIEYVTEDGKLGLLDKFPTAYPKSTSDSINVHNHDVIDFESGRKYWCPELGDCMCTSISTAKDEILKIRLTEYSNSTLGVENYYVTESGKKSPNDLYPIVFKTNVFANDLSIYDRSGRSTRIVDSAIQTFFQNGIVTIFDHHNTNRSNQGLLKRFLSRLKNEHGLDDKSVEVDSVKLTAKMK
jgi:hypothetical protein